MLRVSVLLFFPANTIGRLVSTERSADHPISPQCDQDINTNDTSTPTSPPLGPITRARARQLHHKVSKLLSLYLVDGNAHAFVLLRYDGEDKKGGVWQNQPELYRLKYASPL
jgi:hypothetical protein